MPAVPASLSRDNILAISTLPVAQGAFGVIADHQALRRDDSPHIEPNPRRVDDADQVGDGSEHARSDRLDYIEGLTLPVSGTANFQTCARLGLRALGGTVTPTAVTGNAAASDYAAVMQARRVTTPKFSSLVQLVEGANYRLASFMVNSFQMSWTAGQAVKYSAELLGTGHYVAITDSELTTEGEPPVIDHIYPAAAAFLRFTYNDGTVVDARDEGLLGFSVGFNNNGFVKELPGDPFMSVVIDTVTYKIPYASFIKRGNRTGTLTLKTYQSALSKARAYLIGGKALTSTSIVIPGQPIPGTTVEYEFEWKLPKIKVASLGGSTEDAYAARDITMRLFPDAVTDSLMGIRVRALTTDLLR